MATAWRAEQGLPLAVEADLHVYMHACVCVHVCAHVPSMGCHWPLKQTPGGYGEVHMHIYMHMHMHMRMCMCMCMCMCRGVSGPAG